MKPEANFINILAKHYKKIIFGAVALVTTLSTCGSNDEQNWLLLQYPWGTVKVVDTPGIYLKGFGSHWVYPRNYQVEYNKEHAFTVVFNDGGSASMNAMVRFSSPLTIEDKRKFHQLFGGNQDAIEAAVWAHLSDAMKSSGPVMSASEHQSARRGEFTSLVQDQLQKGLFEMRRISKNLPDQFDDKGKPLTVFATEVVFNPNGEQRVARPSPLTDFGIIVTQFSITEVVYDEQTRTQFSQKKEAFLSAEGSKAQREKEVQQRLMVEERGRREKAEAEAIANKEKAKAIIEAQREKEVQETHSARKVAVALLTKQEAETKAAQGLEVARFEKLQALEEGEAQMIRANAQKQSLELAGAISERERVLAQIEADKQIKVAAELAKIQVPQFIISGSGEDSNITGSMFNLMMLKQMGVTK